MSFLSEQFLGSLGPAEPPTPPGLRFDSTEQSYWESVHAEIGAGYFLDGFLYLFGDGLEPLLACLPPWSFLVPPLERPMILGYNAYGTLLVIKDRAAINPRVGVLDPARVVWWDPEILDFVGLLGGWLPENRIPHFLEHDAYDAWRAGGGRRLRVGEMLAMKMPAALGGAFTPDNFEIADIVRFYQSSGPVYEKTIRKHGASSRRGKAGGKAKPLRRGK